ncbi:uncharacterized protein LOC144747786 [Ciona intestinalis]
MTCTKSNAVWDVADERVTWLRNVFLPKMVKWKDLALANKHPLRVLAKPTMDGVIFTTKNYIKLLDRLLQCEDIKYVCLQTISQDVLEATFGNLRQLGRRK